MNKKIIRIIKKRNVKFKFKYDVDAHFENTYILSMCVHLKHRHFTSLFKEAKECVSKI